MSFNAENIPRVLTQKAENPFLIIGNYVELINHYAVSIGHEGIQCYQYFRVIKVLLRTHISAGSCAVCFAAKPFREIYPLFPFFCADLSERKKRLHRNARQLLNRSTYSPWIS